MTVNIEQVREQVQEDLPDCWLPLEACLSLTAARQLKDLDHCVGLIIVGPSGGAKSTTLELLGRKDPIVVRDNFTPASFVSHDASKSEEELRKIDLLPQLKGKIFVLPEMVTLFDQRKENLMENLAIFTRIMDGRGYSRHSGTHGVREYEGDYRFNFIGATTPISPSVWDALGKLGSRWMFYHLEQKEGDLDESLSRMRTDFREKKERCGELAQGFIHQIWRGLDTLEWDREKDEEDFQLLLALHARIIAQWRGLVLKQDATGYNPVQIEKEDRLRESIYALARGHAIVYGRNQLDWPDVDFATCIIQTNMPFDRLRVFRAFEEAKRCVSPENRDTVALTKNQIKNAMGCSDDLAQRVIGELLALGVIGTDGHGRYRQIINYK